MFEFEDAGGLHDVFLNKNAVSKIKWKFDEIEREIFFSKWPCIFFLCVLIHTKPAMLLFNRATDTTFRDFNLY